MRWLLAIALVGGCGSDPELRPIIDTPPSNSPAYPYLGIDGLSLGIAESEAEGNLREADFEVGQSPELPNVPYGTDLVVHFEATTDGRISAYGRTCAFDYLEGASPDELHLYMARIGRWAEAEAPAGFGSGGFAFAMADGGAGFVGAGSLTRYDVRANQYLPADTDLQREQAAFVALDDGRALVIGGTDGGSATSEIALVDLRLEPGPDAPVLRVASDDRRFGFGAALPGGEAIVAGGESGEQIRGDAQRIVPGGEQGIATDPLPPLTTPRADAVMTRLGTDPAAPILVSGGRNEVGAVAEAELFRPLAGGFEALPTALTEARWGHRAVALPDRSVLIIGGYVADGVTTGSIELFDASVASYQGVLANLTDRAGRVGMSATPLPDGRVLLAGGLDATGNPTDAVFIARLDIQTGEFSVLQATSMDVARVDHSAVLLCDGTVLIAGGADGAPAERYNPPPEGRR
jgi:hypothetical protein